MYATGVGLVIKGFEQLEKDSRRGIVRTETKKSKNGGIIQQFFTSVTGYLNEDHD